MPPTAEEQLIYIGLSYPEWRARIAEALTPEEVEDPALRRIFTELLRPPAAPPAGAAGGPQRPLSLLPPEVQRRLSALWVRDPRAAGEEAQDESPETTVARIVEDCLARIAVRRAHAQRRSWQQALEAAERSGNLEQALALLREHPSVRGGQDKSPERGYAYDDTEDRQDRA
jgi:hypothetical protein